MKIKNKLGHYEDFMSHIYVKNTLKKGRGVFSSVFLKENDLIELCELLILDYSEAGETLERYIFEFSKNKVALALGYGSLYNHSENPNAQAELDIKNKKLRILSLRDIYPGEEITINYGYSDFDKKKFQIS